MNDPSTVDTPPAERATWVWERLAQYLMRHDLKQTKPRRWIITYLLSQRDGVHVSAEQIHLASKEDDYPLGLATVYRCLNLLVDAGIVEQHYFQNSNAVYEISCPNTHHDHLVCLDCGAIKEFEEAAIEALQESVASRLGFLLKDHRLELMGQCLDPACSGKNSSNELISHRPNRTTNDN